MIDQHQPLQMTFGKGSVVSLLLGVAWLSCVPDATLAPPLAQGGAGGSGVSSAGGDGAGSVSSTGGSGGIGGTLSGGGGAAPMVLKSFASSSPELTGYSYDDLGAWLTFRSPNDGTGGAPERTSQISPSTLRRGYTTADVPRARNVDGNGWGLNIESGRTNRLSQSDDMKVTGDSTGWLEAGGPQNYMASVDGNSDPAGGSKAVEFTINDCLTTNSQWSRRRNESGGAMSIWAVGDSGGAVVGGTSYFAHFRHNFTIVPLSSYMQWTRLEADTNGSSSFLFRSQWIYGGDDVCITAATFRAFGAQLEDDEANYVSSYIPTQSVPVTRAAERLYTEQVSVVVPDGYYHARLVFRPRYGSGELEGVSSSHVLLHFNSGHSVYARQSSDDVNEFLICQVANGDAKCSSALSWSAEQELTVSATHTMNGRSLMIEGANETTFTGTWAAEPPISGAALVHILSQPFGASECAELRDITFYQP